MDKYKRIDFRDQIARNKRKSWFLMAVIFAFLILMGYVIGIIMGPDLFLIIMIIAIIFSVSYTLVGFYKSDKIAIASVRAKKASREKYKQYHSIVEGLSIASGLPKPKLYVMHSPMINAFASGRDPQNAVICVTDGALEKLDKSELEGVIGHELSHIANYDIRYITLAAIMVGLIAIVSQIFLRSLWFGGGSKDNKNAIFIVIGIVLAILAPIVVQLVQLAISRKREYAADASAVQFTRYPAGLVRALKKIKYDNAPPEKKVSKAVAPLFFANPFKNIGSTHPPIDNRIKTLERM